MVSARRRRAAGGGIARGARLRGRSEPASISGLRLNDRSIDSIVEGGNDEPSGSRAPPDGGAMTFAGRLLGWLVTASTVVGAAAVFLMMLQIVVDVVMKNLFEFPVPATTIFVTHYYMIVVAYLPVALAERLNNHITVEILVQHFARRVRIWLIAVMWLVSAVVAGAVTHRLWLEAVKKYDFGAFQIEQDVPFITWPSYFVLPAGFGLFTLILLYRFACAVTGAASGLGETPAEATDAHLDRGMD